MAAASPGQDAHQVGDEDLATDCRSAEARSLHDRRPEAVVVLKGHVSGRDPDTDVEGLALSRARMGVRTLLDGDGRRHCIRGALEHCQRAVTKALDQRARVATDGVRNETIVVSPKFVGPFLADKHPEFGRGNQVGHEDRRCRSLRHHLTASSAERPGATLPLTVASSQRGDRASRMARQMILLDRQGVRILELVLEHRGHRVRGVDQQFLLRRPHLEHPACRWPRRWPRVSSLASSVTGSTARL